VVTPIPSKRRRETKRRGGRDITCLSVCLCAGWIRKTKPRSSCQFWREEAECQHSGLFGVDSLFLISGPNLDYQKGIPSWKPKGRRKSCFGRGAIRKAVLPLHASHALLLASRYVDEEEEEHSFFAVTKSPLDHLSPFGLHASIDQFGFSRVCGQGTLVSLFSPISQNGHRSRLGKEHGLASGGCRIG